MELKDRIATFQKNTYNKFWWWRRFQPRQTLTKLHRLEQRVPNGDFEVSDYHWQLLWENVLEQEAADKEPNPDKKHEIRCMFGERRRRLSKDYEADEAKILDEMYKAFWSEFRMKREQVEEEMLNFDGELAEFIVYLSSKQKIKICQALA
jgi:2-polyprenyl-6-methoxyphenol hydroxylase-like FAD-dependent oxidoreductase